MTNMASALSDFFGSFGVPAYMENSVPRDAVLPYLTYTADYPTWDQETIIQARVWYRTASFKEPFAMADKVSDAIGEGLTLKATDGYVHLYKSNPWAQPQPVVDDALKAVYMNIGAMAFFN